MKEKYLFLSKSLKNNSTTDEMYSEQPFAMSNLYMKQQTIYSAAIDRSANVSSTGQVRIKLYSSVGTHTWLQLVSPANAPAS